MRYDPRSEVLVTIGASEAVLLVVMAFCGPGDEVIMPVGRGRYVRRAARPRRGRAAVPTRVRADVRQDKKPANGPLRMPFFWVWLKVQLG
jgi:histidinol-phosphate/aromatic aminotransferase/cobyric acid decarboxylase-like protein